MKWYQSIRLPFSPFGISFLLCLVLEFLRVRCLHMLVQVEDLVEGLRTDTAIVDVPLFFNSFPLGLRRDGTPEMADTSYWSEKWHQGCGISSSMPNVEHKCYSTSMLVNIKYRACNHDWSITIC